MKWNGGVSFPIQSGHGCIGCSEPNFWDAGGFYEALSMPAHPLKVGAAAAAAGVAAGAAVTFFNRKKKGAAKAGHETTTLEDLER